MLIPMLLAAQITFINPFATTGISSANALVPHALTAPTDYPCAPPATGTNGFVPREGSYWLAINDKLGMNNALTWNNNAPYAVCLGTGNDFARVELHDTPFDHGMNDPSTKRRAEFETASKFVNGKESWARYEFSTHVNNLKPGFSVRLIQIHWPSGASPAIGHTIKYGNGGLQFVVSTKNDSTDNVTRGTANGLTQDVVHSVVFHFKLGTPDSFEDTFLDGKLVSHYVGPVGSTKENGYRMRFGNYGTISGMSVVTKYRNITTPQTAGVNMSSFITNPLAW